MKACQTAGFAMFCAKPRKTLQKEVAPYGSIFITMLIQICVGSSCHLKGAPEVVELFKEAVEKNKLEAEVTLAGSFCAGKCSREGVTVTIDDEIHTGVTKENFREFFEDNVMKAIKEGA